MEKIIDLTSVITNALSELEEIAKQESGFTDLTTTQMYYIEVIYKLHNPTISELAGALKLSKPTVTIGIDRLIDKGYVKRVQSDEDKRSAHLHLTDKGVAFNNVHIYSHRKFAEMVEGALSKEEITQLETLLEKITHCI